MRGIYNRIDGGCTIISPSEETIQDLMAGGILTIEQANSAIEARLIEGRSNREEITPFFMALVTGGLTREEAVRVILDCDSPKGIVPNIIAIDEIPASTAFRGAWSYNETDKIIETDIEKAKVIHVENIRKERNAGFIALGFPHRLDASLEMAIIPQATRDKLQALRDAPAIDLSGATTPEELEAIKPNILKVVAPIKDNIEISQGGMFNN